MPEGWESVALREVAALSIDRVTVESDRVYQVAGVLNAGQGMLARDPIHGRQTNYPSLHRLHTDQLVMRKLTAWEGPITVVPSSYDGYFVSPEFPTFVLDRSRVVPAFLRLLCQRPALWNQMRDVSTGSVQRRKRVAPDSLLAVQIHLPPLDQQHRIVDLVSAVDDYQRAAETMAAAARHARLALLSERLNGEGPGWLDTTVDSVLNASIGGAWGDESGKSEIDVTVYRSTDFDNWGRLEIAGGAPRSITNQQLKSRRLQAGDVLLEKSGGGPKQPVGRVVFVDDSIGTNSVCANFVQLLRPNRLQILPRYFFYLLWYWHSSGRTLEFQSQTTGIRNLRTKDYTSQPIRLPSLPAQSATVDLLRALDDQVDSAERVSSATEVLRSAMLGSLAQGDQQIPDEYDALLGSVA